LLQILSLSSGFKITRFFLRVRLVRELGGEEREGELEGEGRGDILIKNVFGSQGEGRRGGGILKLFYCFTLKLN